jgi:hypothetical protein
MFIRSMLLLINVVFTVIEGLLGLRFLLKLFGANGATDFVRWIYETSQPLLTPFQGSFPSPAIERGFVIEFSTLFALIVYGLIAWLLAELLLYIRHNIAEYQREKHHDHHHHGHVHTEVTEVHDHNL